MDDTQQVPQDPPVRCPFSQWREDFPIQWENDHYVTRREMTKFLTLGSALLAGANVAMVAVGMAQQPQSHAEKRIGTLAQLEGAGSFLFTYPTEEDPCILVRTEAGELQAYSEVCTHLACGVIYRPEERTLYCPCHHGYFSAEDGEPTAGPPTRRLPRIRIEQRGEELFATGVEV